MTAGRKVLNGNDYWSTKKEIEFINMIAGKPATLRGYLVGASRRERWGKVKPHRAIKHARERYLALTGTTAPAELTTRAMV